MVVASVSEDIAAVSSDAAAVSSDVAAVSSDVAVVSSYEVFRESATGRPAGRSGGIDHNLRKTSFHLNKGDRRPLGHDRLYLVDAQDQNLREADGSWNFGSCW